MYNIDELKKQHNIERMAREAEKMLGISNAIYHALMDCKGTELADVAGAFDAMQDIAKALVDDLAALAEGVTK